MHNRYPNRRWIFLTSGDVATYLGLECPEGQDFGVSLLAPYPHRWKFWTTFDEESVWQNPKTQSKTAI